MPSENDITRALPWTPPGALRSHLDALAALLSSRDGMRAQRDALTAFLVRVASAAILYLSQVVLARWMGSFEYGIYAFVWTWVLVLGGLSHLGFNTTMIRLLPEYRVRGRLELLRGLVLGGRVLAFVLASAIAIAAAGMLWALDDRISGHYWLPALLAVACLPMYAVTDVQDGIGRGHGSIKVALLPPYVVRPLLLLCAIVAAHAVGMPMTATTAAGGAILATWLAGLIQLISVERMLARDIPPGHRSYDFPGWLATSLPLLAIGAAEIVLQNADVLVVSRYLTPSDVAIYFAAAKTMSLVMFVHYAVGSAVANRISALNARGDRGALQAYVRDAVSWTFWPSLALAAALLVVGKPVLSLFGPQFSDAYPVMLVLVVGLIMRASMGPSELILNMLGEHHRCALVLAAAALIDVVLLFMLVPRLGLVGAALSTAIALAAASAMNGAVARGRLGLDLAIWSRLLPSRRNR